MKVVFKRNRILPTLKEAKEAGVPFMLRCLIVQYNVRRACLTRGHFPNGRKLKEQDVIETKTQIERLVRDYQKKSG